MAVRTRRSRGKRGYQKGSKKHRKQTKGGQTRRDAMRQSMRKYVLAAYYNNARLNALYCLNAIREKHGKDPLENEDQIVSALDSLIALGKLPEKRERIMEQLMFRFPFLNVLSDPHKKQDKNEATPIPRYIESRLRWMFQLLNGLRNTMAHPSDEEFEISHHIHRNLFFALSDIYDSGFHTIKTRFKLEDSVLKPLLRCDTDGNPRKADNFPLALCARHAENAKGRGGQPQSRVLHDFGHVLFCSLFLEKRQSADLLNHFWETVRQPGWDDTERRKLVRELIAVHRARLPVLRLKSDDSVTALTLDTLSELSRCPRPLFDALGPEDQEQYRVAAEAQVDEEQDGDDSFLFVRARQDRFAPLIMRYLDHDESNRLRFAVDLGNYYYNVRLKPGEGFADSKPHVRRLGQKMLGYGRLQDFSDDHKPERWRELERNYEAYLKGETDLLTGDCREIRNLASFIIPTEPHYHYAEDRIGVRLAEPEEAIRFPSTDTEERNGSARLPRGLKQSMEPDFWLSPVQLLHVAFYHYLQRQLDQTTPLHILLRQYRSGMKKLINRLDESAALPGEPGSPERRAHAQQWVNGCFPPRAPFEVDLGSLPVIVKQHLMGVAQPALNKQKIIQRIEHLRDDTDRRLNRIENQLTKNKKRGSKNFRAIKCGAIGDFLAEDILRFQPIDPAKPDGGKINSQQYQILQCALAYYGAHTDQPPRIVDLLEQGGFLKGVRRHPFLPKLGLTERPDRYKGLITFYQAYLKERRAYLNRTLDKVRKGTVEGKDILHWLRLRQPSTLDNWLKEQRDNEGNLIQPLPLPRNLLYRPILEMTARSLNQEPERLEAEGSSRNAGGQSIPPAITWLIKKYLASFDDAPQAMYALDRHHELFDVFLDKRKVRKKPLKNKSFEFVYERKPKEMHCGNEQWRRRKLREIQAFRKMGVARNPAQEAKLEKFKTLVTGYKRMERKINQHIPQDILLFLYARENLEDLQATEEGAHQSWTLKAIERRLLKTKLRREIELPGGVKLFHPACKIRNFGELGLLARDRRLPSLLGYYSDQELHHEEIRAELASYERERVRITQRIQTLEKELVAKMGQAPERTKKEEKASRQHFGKGRHGDYLYMLHRRHINDPGFDEASFHKARLIRNAFAHNQYPDAAEFPDIAKAVHSEPPPPPDNPRRNRKVAARLGEVMERLYQPWLASLGAERLA